MSFVSNPEFLHLLLLCPCYAFVQQAFLACAAAISVCHQVSRAWICSSPANCGPLGVMDIISLLLHCTPVVAAVLWAAELLQNSRSVVSELPEIKVEAWRQGTSYFSPSLNELIFNRVERYWLFSCQVMFPCIPLFAEAPRSLRNNSAVWIELEVKPLCSLMWEGASQYSCLHQI